MRTGVALSVMSSCLFALLFFYTTVLHPMSGLQVFAWRIALGLPALALIITRGRGWGQVNAIVQRLRREPRLWLLLLASAVLVGVQLWLFVWAPLHQRALDVSMGYFLLPISMVLVGRVVYKERLSRMQNLAVWLAVVGVAHELGRTGAFSWVTTLVMLGYPPYFILRRELHESSLGLLWFDMLFLMPIALVVLMLPENGMSAFEQLFVYPRLFLLVPVLGLISSVALAGYLSAGRLLPFGLFGMLGYVEPIMLFWVSVLLLNEPVPAAALFTYMPIWLAVVLIAGEGGYKWLKDSQSKKPIACPERTMKNAVEATGASSTVSDKQENS
ncbi:EamA family transporter RarD [Pusillimonas sp. ANT_WB101]|uniref:EamA family transporter RarD n=1 Tax=Pusillimonas sp. ANT_WB101 TaxID=2597356 RepID=UPI0011EDB3C9|nr:EamA family transporter RarD [Pusillimonas sp. ANT_WB101]KAA0888573.1 EamA family transporter RarD [Pusillimonas sp. ANT_WB101]